MKAGRVPQGSQGLASPVAADLAKQSVLDGIPLVQRSVRVLTGQVRRLGSRRTCQAKQLARRIDATTAVNASAAARVRRSTLYTRLWAVAQASMRQAEQIRRALAERSDAVVQRLESALKHIAASLRPSSVCCAVKVYLPPPSW